MSLKDKLSSIDLKFWFTCLLAIVFGVFTVLPYVYDKINIGIDTCDEINALDINESLKGLKILFKNQDIFEKKLNLKTLTLKIANVGYKDIEPTRFDDNNPFGIQF